LTQTVAGIHHMLESGNSPGTDQKAELTSRMFEQAKELAQTFEELRQLG
jgi:hypothetical protein